MTDFRINDCDSFLVLVAQTPAADDWVAEHLPDDALQWGGGTVIEYRYFPDIADGIVADGLTIGED